MDKSELKSIVNAEIRSSMGYVGGELSKERADAMDYYLGEPFGNEAEGRSQVVSTDVQDTIEWMMPSLMRIFTTSDEAVRFEPTGPEDEEAAKQETDYCNYIFYKKNPGFLIAYSWIKDALLQKVGIVKPHAVKEDETEREEYQGLSQDEFIMLLNDPELEPKEHEERVQTYEIDGQVVEEIVHDIVFERKCSYHKIEIPNVPPEEFLISNKTNCVDPKEAPFVAHRKKMTISELREMGYSKKILEKISSDDSENQNEEWWARHNLSEETDSDAATRDPSMREVTVNECYLKVDFNGDGIAELRKVTLAGNEILDNEEVDRIPFCAMTPTILTHKFFGLSVADAVMDLQLIKSMIWRQTLDNMYQANNLRSVVNYKNINLDDLLNNVTGPIRTKGIPANDYMQLPHQPISQDPMMMMEYIDSVKETRTGVGKQFQGLNADVLKDANIPAVQGLVTAAQQRVEMIARIFAETGFKQLFQDIHELVRKYPNKEEVVKLRGEWIPVDPREWKRRTDMTVTVGLGNASHDSQIMSINQVIADQEKVAMSGGLGRLVSEKNLYNSAVKKAKLLGFKSADEFWMDPDKAPPPPPPQDDPLVKAQTIKSEAEAMVAQMKEQMRQQTDQMKEQLKAVIEMQKDSVQKQKNAIEAWKAQSNHAIQIAKLEAENRVDMGEPGMGSELDGINQVLEGLVQSYTQIAQKLEEPLQIERDAAGNPVSINGKPVQTDAEGRITGVG